MEEIPSGRNETRLYFVDRSEEAEAMLIIVAFVLTIAGVGTFDGSQSFVVGNVSVLTSVLLSEHGWRTLKTLSRGNAHELMRGKRQINKFGCGYIIDCVSHQTLAAKAIVVDPGFRVNGKISGVRRSRKATGK